MRPPFLGGLLLRGLESRPLIPRVRRNQQRPMEPSPIPHCLGWGGGRGRGWAEMKEQGRKKIWLSLGLEEEELGAGGC